MIALAQRGVDTVVRQHQQRITDFRRGQSLGKEDHLARWWRPARPEWMDVETYEQMPEFLDVRELGCMSISPASARKPWSWSPP